MRKIIGAIAIVAAMLASMVGQASAIPPDQQRKGGVTNIPPNQP